MNLYLRLLKTILSSFFKPRLGILEESVLRFRVWPSDLDSNFHMNNGRYFTVMDLGRMDITLRMGLWGLITKYKWMPVIGSAKMIFRRSLRPFEKFELRTQIVSWDEKWVFIEQKYINRDGKLAAVGMVKGAFVGRDGTVPTKEIFGALKVNHQAPEIPKSIELWLEAEQHLRDRQITT